MGWFSKKIEIEITGEDGKLKKVKVPQKVYERWIAEGKISVHPSCTAHIVSPMGNRTQTMVVGEDISQEAHDRFKDAAGDIYVLEVYEAGKPSQTVLPKNLWLQAKDAMDNA